MFVWLSACVVLAVYSAASPVPKEYRVRQYYDNPAVKRFREYIQIDTSKEENLEHAVEFWRRQALEVGLPFTVLRPAGKPICVITWAGANPDLPSIMLNSHMDVVPVEPADWTFPPFSAHIDENGNIYGRGTQDDKDVAVQYLEAIRKLKQENVTLQRTLHVTLMPDEETGGFQGMLPFVNTTFFTDMNVGLALDEGISTVDGNYEVTYIDRRPYILRYTVFGEGGHSLLMPAESAMEKAQKLTNAVMAFRDEQKQVQLAKGVKNYGSYNSININVIQGGIAPNVIPTSVSLTVDIRLATTANAEELNELVERWRIESGNTTKLEFLRHVMESKASTVDDSNPYWVAMEEVIADLGSTITPIVCPAATDMIPLRARGIPALGFSPKTYTTSRIHSSDEYLNAETFLKGIDVYIALLKKLGNL